MISIEFKIDINAPAQAVWFALWDDYNYRLWTSAFTQGSHYKGDLSEGSRIHFLDPKGGGMYSDVVVNKPNEQLTFAHIGNIENFEELPIDEDVQTWTGGKEDYQLSENEGITTLSIITETIEQYVDYFHKHYPNALENVKRQAQNPSIKVETLVNAPLEKTWSAFTTPADVMNWNFASPDWHCPSADNDLQVGGKFNYLMAAKDDSFSFNFNGVYSEVVEKERFSYNMEGDRKVEVIFEAKENQTLVTEIFEAENMNPLDMQKMGWQAILNNFGQYVLMMNVE